MYGIFTYIHHRNLIRKDPTTVDGSEILRQLSLVVYPIQAVVSTQLKNMLVKLDHFPR